MMERTETHLTLDGVFTVPFNFNLSNPDFNFNLNFTGGGLDFLDTGNGSVNIGGVDVGIILTKILGAKRKDINSVTVLTVIYSAIFVTGVVGNVCTCVVIARNAYMHTVTNFYLFSLAVSDVLTLIFALPPELYSIWEAYPWHFGEAFCVFKVYLAEMTSYASVLLITSFTVERYVAICHPIRGHRSSRQSRTFKCIMTIVAISALCALPYPIHTRVFPFAIDPRDNLPIRESVVCNIPSKWINRMSYFFQVSTFVFFIIPMVVITVMYLMIGMKLRQSALQSSSVQPHVQQCKTTATRARRAVLKMLVAVVVAFFLCWAPFHSQRLMTLYIQQWTPELLMVQSHLFYVSGVLYFLSSTINPILYNMLSRKFRQAFKRTLCRCFLDFDSHSIPAFYKLKAKFIVGNDHHHHHHRHHHHPASANQNDGRFLCQDKAIMRMTKFPDNNDGRKANRLHQTHGYAQQSTNETCCKQSSPSLGVSSGAHAHSDGRLLSLCRHRYCATRQENVRGSRPRCLFGSQDGVTALGPSRINTSNYNRAPNGISRTPADTTTHNSCPQHTSFRTKSRQTRRKNNNLESHNSPFRFSYDRNVSW